MVNRNICCKGMVRRVSQRGQQRCKLLEGSNQPKVTGCFLQTEQKITFVVNGLDRRPRIPSQTRFSDAKHLPDDVFLKKDKTPGTPLCCGNSIMLRRWKANAEKESQRMCRFASKIQKMILAATFTRSLREEDLMEECVQRDDFPPKNAQFSL